MQEVLINGITRDLRHLKEFTVTAPGQGKNGTDLRILVSFGLHTVSEGCDAGQQHDMVDENGKLRLFCEDRYAFSLGLPELAKRMIDQNYFCWESSDRNRVMNYAIIDVAPGRVLPRKDGPHHVVFFYLYPAEGQAEVKLIVTSCHSRHIVFSNIKRRYNIHTLLKTCIYKNKRIP